MFFQSSPLIQQWKKLLIPPIPKCFPFNSSPWQWEWILLSRVGFLCPAGHSLSETHWCSPGQKHCWCFLDREWQRKARQRKSEIPMKLALWIIQHNSKDAVKTLWGGKVLDEPCAGLHFMQYGYSLCCVVFYLSTCLGLISHLQPVHKHLFVVLPLLLCFCFCPLSTAYNTSPHLQNFFSRFSCNSLIDNFADHSDPRMEKKYCISYILAQKIFCVVFLSSGLKAKGLFVCILLQVHMIKTWI